MAPHNNVTEINHCATFAARKDYKTSKAWLILGLSVLNAQGLKPRRAGAFVISQRIITYEEFYILFLRLMSDGVEPDFVEEIYNVCHKWGHLHHVAPSVNSAYYSAVSQCLKIIMG